MTTSYHKAVDEGVNVLRILLVFTYCLSSRNTLL